MQNCKAHKAFLVLLLLFQTLHLFYFCSPYDPQGVRVSTQWGQSFEKLFLEKEKTRYAWETNCHQGRERLEPQSYLALSACDKKLFLYYQCTVGYLEKHSSIFPKDKNLISFVHQLARFFSLSSTIAFTISGCKKRI